MFELLVQFYVLIGKRKPITGMGWMELKDESKSRRYKDGANTSSHQIWYAESRINQSSC